ncbi:MAG TPA: twin-arginine translocase subunit TatC [Candidatus Binatia bacterium]|nr:twin-arginine translocase subunit TatC [Candidatus Binatia bacterium]
MIPTLLVIAQEPEQAQDARRAPGTAPREEPEPREPERPMSFLEHLEELRAAVWRSATVAIILIAVAWFFSGRILDALILYLLRGQKALALSPTEAFSARIEVALWSGGAVALPYVVYELWRFVAPGLKKKERRFAIPWMVASAVLLYLGIAFAVELLLPMIVHMLQSFATGQIEARMSILSLLHFTVEMSVGCGLLFQLPLVLCLLAWFGIVSPRVLTRHWRHAVFFIALAAAVVTPGDGPSMLVLSAPLVLLYFVSLVFAWAIWRSRWKGRREPGELG